MPPRGEETREMILQKAARLFNERGFAGASMSDILEATGLQKGGLYNHFASKEDLATEAFDFAVNRVRERIRIWLAGKTTAPERLHAMIDGFVEYAESPPVPGGCPIMKHAVTSPDANPRFRERARVAMEEFLGTVVAIVKGGQKRGELRADADAEDVATVLLSMFEGGLMLSNLNRNTEPMRRGAVHLKEYVDGLSV